MDQVIQISRETVNVEVRPKLGPGVNKSILYI